MYQSIDQIPSNKRVFGACLLSLMTLIAPIASVGAATRRATVPLSVRNTKATASAHPSLVEPPAAMPLPASLPAPVPAPAPEPIFAVNITASKVDSFPDVDGDAKAELGETITYSVNIQNSGSTDAAGVTFNDNIDANTTFVPGSMHASPIAFDDTYNWVGNTVLDTSARSLPSTTANDVAVTDSFTAVTQTNAPTTQGGAVTLAANGHFVYTPQLGDGGPGFSDTFNYTIQNSADPTLVGTGTVTINMPVRVWYLQAGAAGDGRSLTPSGNAATISSAANLASDILYVYFNAGTLNGAFTLDTGQTLTGEGVALVANSITLRPAGSAPTITNTTGNAVTLGGTNLVTGLSISQANNFAIIGTTIGGTTNITGVPITNSTTGGGLSLTTQTGTFNMTNSPISGTTSGTAVLVSGTTGAINFSNSPVSRTTGRLIDIQSKTGGSVLFNGGSTVTGTSIATDAIVLLNHTGGTTFTFSNNVNITTTAGRGIRADNTTSSFSLTMNAAGNTISATGGAALDVEDVAANMAFTSTSSTNSSIVPAHGLRVSTTTGSLSFGTTGVSGSANTGVLLTSNTSTLTFGDLDITPAAGQRGLHATSNTGTITTTSGSITTTTGTGVEITGGSTTPLAMVLTLVSVGAAPSGIVIQNNSGSFSVIGDNSGARNGTGGVMTGTTDDAIRLTNGNNITLKSINLNSPGDTPDPLLGNNESSPGEHGIEAIGGSNVIVSGVLIDSPTGSGMIALNLTGTNRLNSNSLVTNVDGPATHGLYIENTTASLTLFEVNNTDFTSSSSGASTVFFRNGGTANMNVDVVNTCLFDGLNGQAITATSAISAGTTGTLTTNIKNNTFSNAQGTSENNVGVLVSNGGTHVATVESNLFDNIAEDGSVANTSIIRTQNTGGKLTAVIKSNTIQNIAYTVGGRHVIGHVFEPPAYNATDFSNIRIEGNTASNITYTATNREFIFMDYRQFSSGGDIKILGNNWNMPTSASTSEAIDLNFRPANPSTIDLQVDNNGNGTGAISNTGTRFLRIDVEESTIGNVTVTNNKFTNTNGAPGTAIDFSTNDDPAPGLGGPPTMCVNVSGNNVTAAGNTIRLNEAFGTMNVTQASSAAVSTANNAAVVTVVGTPTFGAPACQLPSNLNFDPNETSQSLGAVELPTNQAATDFLEQLRSNSLASITGVSVASSSVPWLSQLFSGVTSSISRFANSVDSLIVPAAYAETEKTEVRSLKSEVASQKSEVRSNHAKGRRSATTNTATNSLAMAPPAPPLTPLVIGTLPANKSVTVKFQVTVNTTGLGAATSVSNQGNVTYTGGPGGGISTDDPSVGGAADPTVTPISRLDVQVTKTDGVTVTTPGSDLTYTLTYTNNDHGANGVVLTETVPVGTTFKAAGSSVWTGCANGAPAGTVCTINLGNLPRNGVAGFTGTRTFVVTVLNPAPAGVNNIVNTGSIAHDGSYEPDINTVNNTTTDTDTLTAVPDLNISKNDGVGATTPGSTLTYTINYSNVGNQNATGVVLTETVPTGTTYVAAGSSAWSCADGSPAATACTINVGNLNGGGGAGSATFKVLVINPAAAGLASIVNTASIADDAANGTDPTLPNTATDTDTLNATPDLTISKVPNVSSVAPGDTIVYTITYANAGTQNATGVVITETVPVHTKFSTADSSPTVWSCADNSPAATSCTTTIGGLAGGGSGGTVKFGVKVLDPLPGGATQISNTATIADDGANGADPIPANNTTGAVITPIITCTPPPANMTNWWTGDDTPRDIAGGKDGTLNGGMGYAAAKVLNGFNFDGVDDYVDVGDVDLPSTFTIDAWVNPTDLTSERAIVNKDSGVERSYFFHITTTGALRALVQSGGGTFTQYQTAAGVVTAGSLQHVAVTYDGAAPPNQKMLFYKNGVLVASTVQSGQDNGGTPENVPLAARIGRSADGSGLFLGVIDEVEFFSRVLSAAELLAIFNADAGGKCKPSDLKITKTHTDPFVQGSTGNNYTITVHNDGPATTTGTTTVTDQLPAGLTATALSGSGWTCTPLGGGIAGPTTLTCTSTAAIASGADFPTITLTVTVGPSTPNVINTVTVSGGGEMDTSDDTASDPTTVNTGTDLTILKSHTGIWTQGDVGKTYTIAVSNVGGTASSGLVTVTDIVPIGLTPTAPIGAHNGWTCGIASQTLTCTRSDVLAASASYPNITLTVNVSGTAPASVTNTATVSGGNDVNGANNSSGDLTNISVLNFAPVLDNTGDMSLHPINQDVAPAANPGTLVSDIIASADGDRITDGNPGAVEGLAVFAVDNTNGTWEFTINNGTNWTPFGSPDPSNARLLAADGNTRVRFLPNAGFNGTVDPGITFRAWDQTSGTNGNTADVTTNGGSTAFSTATETASIRVILVDPTQVQRTFVSARTGNDANQAASPACSITLPCRNYNVAISKTKYGGEVVALGSGDYGPLTISKSVTLTGPATVYAAIPATGGGSAITISAAGGINGDTIVLKGLTLIGLGGSQGLNVTSVGNLRVEGCVISGFFDAGIRVNLTAAGSRISINDTITRSNGVVGVVIASSAGLVRATIDNSRSEDNGVNGFYAANNSDVTINRSFAASNSGGAGFLASSSGAGVSSQLNCKQCVASKNGTGFSVVTAAGSTATIRVAKSMATNNLFGFAQSGSGVFESLTNNLVRGNPSGNSSGAITPVPAN